MPDLRAWLSSLSVEQPTWLLLLAAIPVLVWWSRRSLAALAPLKRWLAVLARAVVLGLLALALARVQFIERSERQTVVFLLDRSKSILPEAQQRQDDLLRQATAPGRIPDGDRVAVLTFAGTVNIEQPPQKGGVHYTHVGQLAGTDRTDIAYALRMALATFPPDSTRRVVLMSDGNQNVGDALSEVAAARAGQVRIDVVPDVYSRPNEVLVERVVIQPTAKVGERARVRVVLRSTGQAAGRVQLFVRHDGRSTELKLDESRQRVTLEPGISVFPRPTDPPLDLLLPQGGVYQVEALFTPDAAGDTVAENNKASAFVNVESRGRVLIISGDPDADAVLQRALVKEDLECRLVTPAEVPLTALTLQQFDAVILSNVGANQVSEEGQRALKAYVYDLGGGLAMIGGDASFGAGGWIGSPLAEALPVDLEVKHRRELPRGALAIICHACEMPQGNFWGVKTAQAAVDSLSSLDWVGVVTYGWQGGVGWAVPLQLATAKARIKDQIAAMVVGDMPSLDDTLEVAIKGLTTTARDAGQKHIIIISDGDPGLNVTTYATKLKANKITVACVEVFPHTPAGASTPMRQLAIAVKPTGQALPSYYYIDQGKGDAKDLPAIFIKEARLIQRPLIRDPIQLRPLLASTIPETVSGLGPTGSLLPMIRGYVLTQKKPLTETPIVSDNKDQDPILAHWVYGRGKTVAFTSGLWTRWGQDWAGWDRFSKFWAQVVRWMMRQSKEAGLFDISPPRIEGGRGKVTIEAIDADGSFISGDLLNLAGVVVGPDGTATAVPVQQTGPGRYEADVPLADQGDYVLNLPYQLRRADGTTRSTGSVRTGLSVPYSPEFRDTTANEPLLRAIAEKGAGRYVPPDPQALDQTNFFERNLPPIVTPSPRWWLVLAWALFLFLVDVAIRRISVDWPAVYAGVVDLLRVLSGRRRADAREAEAVGSLLQRREQVREALRAPAPGQIPPPPPGDAGPPLAGRSGPAEPLPFDAPVKTPPITSIPPAKPAGDEPASLSERLKRAKQKAQEKMREE